MLSHLTHAVVRRALDGGAPDFAVEFKLPIWTGAVALLDLILLLPVLLIMSYTLHQVVPILAMVEDENPPTYEPLAQTAGDGENSLTAPAGDRKLADPPIRASAVTSSLRMTLRRLRSHGGGFGALFRGFGCKLFLEVVVGAVTGLMAGCFTSHHGNATETALFSAALSLLPAMALVQFRAAWVHTVVTPPSSRSFWRRLPTFSHAYTAAILPMILLWVAEITTATLAVYLHSLHIPTPAQAWRPGFDVPFDAAVAWKGSVVLLAILSSRLFLILPAEVVLVRVLASLLPADETTIVPFDRSFQGRLQSAVLPWATIADAWHTFSRAAWRRLVLIYVKVLVACVTLGVLVGLFLLPQVIIGATLGHVNNQQLPPSSS